MTSTNETTCMTTCFDPHLARFTSADKLIHLTSEERTPYPSPPPTPPRRLTTSGRRSRWDWNTIPHDNEQSKRYIDELNAAMTRQQKKNDRLGVKLQERALHRKARKWEASQRRICLWKIWLHADENYGLAAVLSGVRAREELRARVERLEELVGMKVETFMVTCLDEQAKNEGLDLEGLREWVDEGWPL